VKPAYAVSFPRLLPSGPRCLTDPARQPLSIVGRNRYAPDPIPRPLPFQTHPLPLLLTVPRCSVQATVSCPSRLLTCRLACWPLASHVATEASHRPAAPVDRCHRRCTATMLVPSTQRQCLTQRLCFLLPCWHSVWLRLASSYLAPRRVGTVRWHAHACHVATTSPPCPAHLLATGVWTKMPSTSSPRQPLSIAASLRSAPDRVRSHYLSMVMCCTPRPSCLAPLSPCMRL
jgi:hypothetical protein